MEQIRARVARTIEKGVQIDLSTVTCKRFLRRHASRKTTVVVLYVDIDGSTQMTLSLPSDVLAMMLQLFSQEMSIAVTSFGGYVLKYVGDAVIALFPSEHDKKQACASTLECGRMMIELVGRCINPVLCAKGMPELKVKISMDLGEVLVVLYGKSLENSHMDIIGSSISMAAKMLSLVQSGKIIMGQSARDSLPRSTSEGLVQIDADESAWSYTDASKSRYRLYTT